MTFTVDLSRICAKAQGNVENVVRKVTIETFRKVILKSPVDTGRFRANWIYATQTYSTATSEAVDKGGGATASRIAAQVASTRINGAPLYLTNSLPYAKRLEEGYSRQAPSGMVKLSLMEISAKYGR